MRRSRGHAPYARAGELPLALASRSQTKHNVGRMTPPYNACITPHQRRVGWSNKETVPCLIERFFLEKPRLMRYAVTKNPLLCKLSS